MVLERRKEEKVSLSDDIVGHAGRENGFIRLAQFNLLVPNDGCAGPFDPIYMRGCMLVVMRAEFAPGF
jgi:hypothetical protein